MVIKETGIWLSKDGDNQEWLGSSPAGLIEQNGILKTVIEKKCKENLFLTKKGLHLTYTPNHAGNVLPINKTITITMTVVWTPIGTKVFLIERDDAYKHVELLLNYLYKFLDLASRKLESEWYEGMSLG